MSNPDALTEARTWLAARNATAAIRNNQANRRNNQATYEARRIALTTTSRTA